jgi:hypothetical protein
VPDVHSPGFVQSIRAEIDRLPYVAVLPTSDTTLIALGDPGARFVDKESLFERAEAAGLGFPPTEMFASGLELVGAAGRLDYPVIVKPAVGKPPRRADGPEDISWWRPKTARLIVQPFLTEPIRTVNGVMWEGRLAAVAHQRYLRVWPPDAGMALAAETIEPDAELEERVVSFMEGYSGIFELELCGPYLLDVNARIYGSVMLAVKAGANLPAIYCDLLRGRPVGLVRARTGVSYRWLEADIRYVLAGVRSGRLSLSEAAGLLRPRLGVAYGGAESLTDPGPMFARLKYALRTGGWTARSADEVGSQ